MLVQPGLRSSSSLINWSSTRRYFKRGQNHNSTLITSDYYFIEKYFFFFFLRTIICKKYLKCELMENFYWERQKMSKMYLFCQKFWTYYMFPVNSWWYYEWSKMTDWYQVGLGMRVNPKLWWGWSASWMVNVPADQEPGHSLITSHSAFSGLDLHSGKKASWLRIICYI